MALYDLSNAGHVEQFNERIAKLLGMSGKPVVELTVKKQRSLPQNAYLHVILTEFANHYGETTEYVKQNYFKELVNADIFVGAIRFDSFKKNWVRTLRSSADITTEEMTLAIDRFRDWAAREAGVYLPSPDDYRSIQQMEIQHSHNKQYL